MPSGWVAAVQEAVLHRVAAALDSAESSGAMLVGSDGVGKSMLAGVAADRVAERQPATVVRRVSGTASERIVPFGAFRGLIGAADVGADVGKPAALLRAAQDALIRNSGAGLLLMVDDAHDLDSLSATLVYRLAMTDSARLMVTVRSGAEPPDAVSALWSDGLISRVDVEPLDTARTAGLLESVLGAPLDAAAADEVFRRSLGNPLYLRRLVEDGELQFAHGRWHCRGDDRPPLRALIDGYLSRLSAPVRDVLNFLAVVEPLPRPALAALAGGQAVDDAETAGTVTSRDCGDETMLYSAHPLYAERARAGLEASTVRALRTSIVAQLATRPCEHVSDRLRLSALAVESDTTDAVADITNASNIVDAAQQALRLGDLPLSERLARAALDRSAGLAARLPLAHALAWQGRGREAGAVLAAVDPDELSETELMAWALPRAANQFWMLSEPERATAFLQTTRNRIADPAARSTIDALSATFAMNAGNLRRAIALAGEVLAAPAAPDIAVAWAASAAALSSARMGRLGDVESLAERAFAAEHPGLLRFTVGLAQITSFVMAGDIARAHALARRFTDFAELQQPGRAIGDALLAHVLIIEGEFGAAATLLEPAAGALERTGYSWGALSLMLLATTLAQRGETAAAAKALSRAESRHGTKSALFAPELWLARAWSKAAARDVTGAITAAREAARTAERAGQSAVALRAWHDAVRMGDTRAVDPLSRLAAEVNCPVGRIAAGHARALTAGDPADLAAVSDELAAVGMYAAAADAAAAAKGRG